MPRLLMISSETAVQAAHKSRRNDFIAYSNAISAAGHLSLSMQRIKIRIKLKYGSFL